MKIKTALNVIALLSIGMILVLAGYIWWNSERSSYHLDQMSKVETFARKSSEINNLTEQYISYGHPRYFETWAEKFSDLKELQEDIDKFDGEEEIYFSFSSIERGFELLRDLKENADQYENDNIRERLLERTRARIRSDLQLFLSTAQRINRDYHQNLNQLQVSQRRIFMLILLPFIFLVGFFTVNINRRIIDKIHKILKGTRKIREEDLDHRIPVRKEDELDELADHFNSMTQRVQELVGNERILRKEAENNRQKWEGLVANAPNLIMITVNDRVKFINPAGARKMGEESPEKLFETDIFERLQEQPIDIGSYYPDIPKGQGAIYKVSTNDEKPNYLLLGATAVDYAEQRAQQWVGLDVTPYIHYEDKLRKSLEEKTALLQEVHHRVKNNLAVVTSLLQMEQMKTGNPIARGILQKSEARIHAMALIHECLYGSESLSRINLKSFLSQIFEGLEKAYLAESNVKLHLNSDTIELNANLALPCGLIINELVTNAIQHGFDGKDRGWIKVSVKKDENNIVEVEVRDNGKGGASDFDPAKSDSMGFNIVDLLIQQLEGKYRMENKAPGTAFTFSFKSTAIKGSVSSH